MIIRERNRAMCDRPENGGTEGAGLNASATVEAAFIIPIIVFSLIAYLWLLFFMYARIKLEADIDMAINKAADCYVLTKKTGEEAIPADLLEAYIKDYPYCRVSERELKIEKNTVTVQSGIRLKAPRGGLIGRFTERFGSVFLTGKLQYCDRAQIKRYITVTKKTFEQGERSDDPD